MSEQPQEPIDIQRILMDRARRMAERDDEPHERPLLPRLVGIGLALVVVVVVLFAFDRFLASMQRFLGLPVVAPEAVLTEPLPAYAVTEEAPAPDQPALIEVPPPAASPAPADGAEPAKTE